MSKARGMRGLLHPFVVIWLLVITPYAVPWAMWRRSNNMHACCNNPVAIGLAILGGIIQFIILLVVITMLVVRRSS